jgi:LmbE family N-acetylglucosaminyl deacetylase
MPRIYNVVSPHLDDAALSCSLLLAANPGSHITTIFANGPSSVRPLPPWDRAARYFADGADVMGTRREEDHRAAALVMATAIHLPYWDRQYRNERYGYQECAEKQLFDAVAEDLLRRCPDLTVDGLVIPLGLGHPDHRLAADVGLMLAENQPGPVFLYEELPYAVEDPADAADRKELLAQRGFVLEGDETLEFLDDRALKKAVFRCHASQRRQLRWRARKAIRTPERVWRLARCR